jgi:diacylglycerol kinase
MQTMDFWSIIGSLVFMIAGIGELRIYKKTKYKFALFNSLAAITCSLMCIVYLLTHITWLAAILAGISLIPMTVAEVLETTIEKNKYDKACLKVS